jgi:hypothetical protein
MRIFKEKHVNFCIGIDTYGHQFHKFDNVSDGDIKIHEEKKNYAGSHSPQ